MVIFRLRGCVEHVAIEDLTGVIITGGEFPVLVEVIKRGTESEREGENLMRSKGRYSEEDQGSEMGRDAEKQTNTTRQNSSSQQRRK